MITGSGFISKTGAGTLVLSGTNTFAGDVAIRAGTLSIANGVNLGSGNKQIKMFDGGTLAVTANATLANNLTFVTSGNPNFDIAAGTTTILQGVISNVVGPSGTASALPRSAPAPWSWRGRTFTGVRPMSAPARCGPDRPAHLDLWSSRRVSPARPWI